MTPPELGCESRLSRKTAYRRRYVDCVALSRTGSRQPIYDGDWEAQYGIPKGAKELQKLVAIITVRICYDCSEKGSESDTANLGYHGREQRLRPLHDGATF